MLQLVLNIAHAGEVKKKKNTGKGIFPLDGNVLFGSQR